MPLWELLDRGRVWVEIYRTTVIAERKAAAEIQARAERRQRMAKLMSGGRGR